MRVLAHLKFPDRPEWVGSAADATTHSLSNPEGELVCVVCLAEYADKDPVEIAGLLVHEAVHVWQQYCGRIGETAPGREQEAYGIQAIAQDLMDEFRRRVSV